MVYLPLNGQTTVSYNWWIYSSYGFVSFVFTGGYQPTVQPSEKQGLMSLSVTYRNHETGLLQGDKHISYLDYPCGILHTCPTLEILPECWCDSIDVIILPPCCQHLHYMCTCCWHGKKCYDYYYYCKFRQTHTQWLMKGFVHSAVHQECRGQGRTW